MRPARKQVKAVSDGIDLTVGNLVSAALII